MYADFSGAAALAIRDGGVQCHSERASDYYGLGVRLGVYFAWLGGYIANTILPSEFGPASDTNTIFILTLLIAMANDSRTRELSQIDGLILMHLCGGTVFGILSVWGYRTRLYYDRGPRAVRLFGGFGTHIRLVVSLGVSIFGLWFWTFGITGALHELGPGDGSDPPNPPECATLFTFFFAKIRADGGIRIYYILVCASCVAYFGVMLLASSLAAWFSFDRFVEVTAFHRWTSANRTKYATGFSKKELSIIFKFLRVSNLFWLIFSALMVEFTLNFNNVDAVLGGKTDGGLQLPGQLLPFLVGVFSFIRTCYKLVEEKWWGIKEGAVDPHHHAEHHEIGLDELQITEEIPLDPANTEPHGPNQLAEQQEGRSGPVRFLVAWLPWLGLVINPSRKSRFSVLVRETTGLSTFSRPDEETERLGKRGV